MSWTMPRRILQIVAGLIGLVAVGAFALGVANAPGRSRLPGEKATGGVAAGGAAIEATDATPLSQERIEGPPPPPELTPEQKAKIEADKKAKEEAAAQAAADDQDDAANPAASTAPAAPAGAQPGTATPPATPQPDDEPPHE